MIGHVVWDHGVSIPGHRLWLDPLTVRSFAFISHAHTDHARRHKEALLTPQTLALIPEARRPRGWRMLGFGEKMRRGDGSVSLHSAGHMLGSAMLHFENDGWSVLYTGDVKLRQPGGIQTSVPKSDVLIMETTYGRPHFRFGDPDETIEMIARWCRRALDSRVTPVLLCHALGKTEEVMLVLAQYGFRFALEKRCVPCAQQYALAGRSLPDWIELNGEPVHDRVVIVAPAMDGEMYAHPATRANVARLRDDFGYRIVEPDAGALASGQSGRGRLAETSSIVDAVTAELADRPLRAPDPAERPPQTGEPREADLEGRHLLITAGGTAEPIDPVRFIGNRSTGKMGVALAQAALDRGARVTIVAAHVSVPLPDDADSIRVETTAQMRDAVLDLVDGADALIMAAAVADFRPRRAATTKLSRSEGLTIELEPTEDILAGASAAVRAPGARRPRPILVGFAAETGSIERATEKLTRKGVDLLVANDVAEEGSGFGTDTNRVTILSADGTEQALPLLSKREVADRILDRIVAALDDRDDATQTEPMPQEIGR